MPAFTGNKLRRSSMGKRSWSIEEEPESNGFQNEFQEIQIESEPARKISVRMSSIDELVVRENMNLKFVLEQIHEEYFNKIEGMKQEKYNLQCEVEACEDELSQKDGTIMDLKEELDGMKKIRQKKHDLEREMKKNESVFEFELKQRDVVITTAEKKLKECQKQLARENEFAKTAYDELHSENENLKISMLECEDKNKELLLAVKSLERQLKIENMNGSGSFLIKERNNDINCLKNTIYDLNQRCHLYEESLKDIVIDGKVFDQETAVVLKQQLDSCQYELQMARKKNRYLIKQLEDCLINHPSKEISLLEELDSSTCEKEELFIPNDDVFYSDDLYEKQMRHELETFHKLFEIRNALNINNYQNDKELREMNKNIITNLLDDIIIQNGSSILNNNIQNDSYISRDTNNMDCEALMQFANDLKTYLDISAHNYEKLERDFRAINMYGGNSTFTQRVENMILDKRNENKKIKEYLEAICKERDIAYRMIKHCKDENEKLVLENFDINQQLYKVVKQKQELLEEREQAELDMEMVIHDRLQKATQQENTRQTLRC